MSVQTDSLWGGALEKIKTWARVNSPWAIHYNSGSCNGCDIEIVATLTPRYDVERFGIKLQGSPRHADVLICTGPGDAAVARSPQAHLRADARPEVRGGRGVLRHVGRGVPGAAIASSATSTRSSP